MPAVVCVLGYSGVWGTDLLPYFGSTIFSPFIRVKWRLLKVAISLPR